MSTSPPPFAAFARLASTQVYHSRWCGVRRDEIELPDGTRQDYHVVEISDAVVVVPQLANGRLLLIWQYRYPHGKTHWEVPAGRMHENEAPELAAERELLEETGHRAARLVPLPGFYPINGISDHYAHAFLAEGCERAGEPRLDPSEQLVTREFERGEVERMLRAGEIADGFSALALLYAFERWRR